MALPPDLQNSGPVAVEATIPLLDYGLIVHLKEPTALFATGCRRACEVVQEGAGRGGFCLIGRVKPPDEQFVRMMRVRRARRMLSQPANQNTPNSRLGPAA